MSAGFIPLNIICAFNIQGRESYLCYFIKNTHTHTHIYIHFTDIHTYTFSVGLYLRIYRPTSVKRGMMIKATKLNILISVWMALTFFEGHSCMRNRKLRCPFSRKFNSRFGWNSVCFCNLLVCWSSFYIDFVHWIWGNQRLATELLLTGINCQLHWNLLTILTYLRICWTMTRNLK